MSDQRHERLERWLAAEDGATPDAQILTDPHLAEEAFAALDLATSLQEATARPARSFGRPAAWVGGLMVAALALFILLPRPDFPDGEGPTRLRNLQDAPPPVALAPQGSLPAFPREFRWQPGTGDPHSRYRWELFDAHVRRRAVAVVQDTFLVRPAAQTPADSLGTWRWMVVEILPDGREGGLSRTREFQVNPANQTGPINQVDPRDPVGPDE